MIIAPQFGLLLSRNGDIIVKPMFNRSEKHANTTELLEHGKILPLVFRLTVPAVIAQLITFLYNIVDRMYVAKIDGAGMDALAALGVVLPVTLIIQAFSNLIGLGGSPRAGMKLGEGDGAVAAQAAEMIAQAIGKYC